VSAAEQLMMSCMMQMGGQTNDGMDRELVLFLRTPHTLNGRSCHALLTFEVAL